MEYVRFGSTGMQVSRICLGTMSYGGPNEAWPWALDEETSRPFVKRALELGINFFDTANVYSSGRSEEIVGKALRDFSSRDEVVIATKVFFQWDRGPTSAVCPENTSSARSTPVSSAWGRITSICTRSTAGIAAPQ